MKPGALPPSAALPGARGPAGATPGAEASAGGGGACALARLRAGGVRACSRRTARDIRRSAPAWARRECCRGLRVLLSRGNVCWSRLVRLLDLTTNLTSEVVLDKRTRYPSRKRVNARRRVQSIAFALSTADSLPKMFDRSRHGCRPGDFAGRLSQPRSTKRPRSRTLFTRRRGEGLQKCKGRGERLGDGSVARGLLLDCARPAHARKRATQGACQGGTPHRGGPWLNLHRWKPRRALKIGRGLGAAP